MEYNYPKLLALRFVNFRSLGDVTIDLSKSPIVFLSGRNEIGKSSVTFGVRLLGTNKEPRTHKEFIRSGTAEWQIFAAFSDGTVIRRTKAEKGQAFDIFKPNEKGQMEVVYHIDKLDDNEVPKPVQDYMGFCIEPETKEVLNVRLYKDLMLFVDTSSSTDYKVMYNALKIDSIYKAIQRGTKEANERRTEVNDLKTSIATCQSELRKIHLVDTAPLVSIKASLKQSLGALQSVAKANSESREIAAIKHKSNLAIQLKPLSDINEVLVATLERAHRNHGEFNRLLTKTARYREAKNLQQIDTHELDILEAARRKTAELAKLLSANRKAQAVKSVECVDENLITVVQRLSHARDTQRSLDELRATTDTRAKSLETIDTRLIELLGQAKQRVDAIEKQKSLYAQSKSLANEIHQKLHDSGAVYGVCPNCGELVLMNTAESEQAV